MMKAGTYYVGDLCYVFDDEDWQEICGLMYDTENDGHIVYNGIEMFWANTKYGDGTYYDQYGHEYPVDAGLIGAVRLEDLKGEKAKNIRENCLGDIVDFDRDFTCSSDDGIIYIGKYIIDTDPQEDYYEENDDWNDEEDDVFDDDYHGYIEGLRE